MKRLYVIAGLVLLAVGFLPIGAMAYDAKIDGIYYNLITKAKMAEVTNGDEVYSGELNIPATVDYEGMTYTVQLKPYVFRNSDVTKITLSDDMATICEHAFDEAVKLTEVKLPEYLEIIPDYTFYKCWQLATVSMPSNLKEIGESAFENCISLTSVGKLPDTLISLGEKVFAGSMIESVELPKGLSAIPAMAFTSCEKLKSIVIPDCITSIGDFAFSNSGLKSVFFQGEIETMGYFTFYACKELTDVKLPDHLKRIVSNMFAECEVLTRITLPENVEYIGDQAFSRSGLSEIELPASITTIDGGAFSECSHLESIRIPERVDYINNNMFIGCTSLKTVVLPAAIKQIYSSAFEGCSAMDEINLSEGITSVGERAFYGCKKLKCDISLPNIQWIGSCAFCGCENITKVLIGKHLDIYKDEYGVKHDSDPNWGRYASCKNLTDFYCYIEAAPKVSWSTFDDSYINYATLHVPVSSIEDYRTTYPWSEFGKIEGITDTGINHVEISDPVSIYYDLNGVRHSQPHKGINIQNGKKEIIK